MSLNTVRHYIRRSRNGVTRASLFLSKPNGDEILHYISMQCKALKHLNLKSVGGRIGANDLHSVPFFPELQALVISADLTMRLSTVSKLLDSCKKLSRAEFHRVVGSTLSSDWTSGISGIRFLTVKADLNATKQISLDTLVSVTVHPVGL